MLAWNKRKCPTCGKKLKGKFFGYCSNNCKDEMLKEIEKAGYKVERNEVGDVVIRERKTEQKILEEKKDLN